MSNKVRRKDRTPNSNLQTFINHVFFFKDRYILIGNHYDAWTYGGIDPSSATATHLELTRVFGEMYRDGWRPRR